MGARLLAGAKWARFAFEGTCLVGRGLIFLVIQVQAAAGKCTVLTSDSRGEVPQAVRLQVQAGRIGLWPRVRRILEVAP